MIATADNGAYDAASASYSTQTLSTTTYNRYGDVIATTDQNGLTTAYAYDAYGRQTEVIQEDVSVSAYQGTTLTTATSDLTTTTTYDLLDRPVSVVASNGLITDYTYDTLGNVLSIVTSDGTASQTTSYTYDRFNNVQTTTDALNQVTTTIYDALGNLIKTITPNQEYTLNTYDELNNLTAVESFNATGTASQKTEYVYDAQSQVIQTKEYRTTAGVLTAYLTTNTYTKFGELASVQDPSGYTILYTYDDMGNKIHADYGDQNEIAYTYDTSNRLIQVVTSTRSTDLYNQFTVTAVYSYYRDGKLRTYVANQPAEGTAEVRTVNYAYTANQLSRKVTTLSHEESGVTVISAQETVDYTYDQRGLLTTLKDQAGQTDYFYDQNGNPTQIIRITQNVIYDSDFNETMRIEQSRTTVGYTYDIYDRKTAVIYPDNSLVSYGYDDLDRLTSVSDQNGTTTYSYDALNNQQTTVLASGETTVATYERGNIVRLITTYFDQQQNTLITMVDETLTYDESGNVLSDVMIKNGVTTTTLNTYDQRSELTESEQTCGPDKTVYRYVLDPFGNKNEVINYYENDVLSASHTSSYTYNHLNQLASATIDNVTVDYDYDAYGNLLSEDNGTTAITYTYDLSDNLISYNDGTSYQFSYDGAGNRLSKTVGTTEVSYVNDLSLANEEVLTYTTASSTIKLTYGNELLYEDSTAYFSDAYGNIIIHGTEEYAYAPYGTLTSGQIDSLNEYGYKGEVHDNDRLQYLRARYYNTDLTQFISEDTYTGTDIQPLTQNRYSFALNNPYKYSDPSGNRIVSIIDNDLGGGAGSQTSSSTNNYDKTSATGYGGLPATRTTTPTNTSSSHPGSPTSLTGAGGNYTPETSSGTSSDPTSMFGTGSPTTTVTKTVSDYYTKSDISTDNDISLPNLLHPSSAVDNPIFSVVKFFADPVVDAFSGVVTSTKQLVSDLHEDFSFKTIANYVDSNLQNIATIADVLSLGAFLAVGAVAILNPAGLVVAGMIAGNIAAGAGITMGVAGGLQVLTGITGKTLGGDSLSGTERIGRTLSGGLNILGGYTSVKAALRLEGYHNTFLSKAVDKIDGTVSRVLNPVRKLEDKLVNKVKTAAGKLKTKAKAVVARATDKVDDVLRPVKEKAKSLRNSAVETIETSAKKVSNKVKGYTDKIKSVIFKNSDNVSNGGNKTVDAASMAKKWQGDGAYPGVDNWTNKTIKKGTKIWGGAPGQSNFYTTEEVMQSVGNDATKLNQGLQVSRGNYTQYRQGMTLYEANRDIIVGYSNAMSNPQYGRGGFEQYFVPDYDEVLNPIKSIIMKNR